MNCGSFAPSCRFNCGVMLGESPLAIFSKSRRVSTVLQSAGFFAAAVFAGAALASPVAAGLDDAAAEVAGQTPVIVITTASSGTSGAGAGCGVAFGACGAIGVGAAAPGGACPQAIVLS